MTPVVLEMTSKRDQRVFAVVERLVNKLPDIDLGKDEIGRPVVLTCHILAIALGLVIPLCKVVHGHYLRFYQHSWLLGPDSNVIDPYPVGILGGPIMVANDQTPLLPGLRMYFPAGRTVFRKEYSEMFSKRHFKRSVGRIARELEKLS
jgi:hypothetical protein